MKQREKKREAEQEMIRFSKEQIEEYLIAMTRKGRSPASIQCYRTALKQLYDFLDEEKALNRNTMQEWKKWLESQEYSVRTVNARTSVVNNYLRYAGKKEWQVDHFFSVPDDIQPELTRTEYRRLLQAARNLDKEKAYLLIKVLGGAGMRIQELPQLTVEAVQQRNIMLSFRSGSRVLRIPDTLKQELLAYISREGLSTGPVFIDREGMPMNRFSVWQCIKSVSREARVPEEKATPRCLWKMYQSTYADIQSNIASLVQQAYERMLDEEQVVVGWEI